MLKGIDVSHYQGEINWEKVKPQIDFAILRIGLVDDIKSLDEIAKEVIRGKWGNGAERKKRLTAVQDRVNKLMRG